MNDAEGNNLVLSNRRSTCLACIIALVIVCLLMPGIETPCRGGDVQTVTVGVYENAPKVFTSGSGKPSGIFIDVIEQIARTEGWNLRYVRGTWAQGLDRLAKGEIDLMPDVAYTAEREKLYDFHQIPVLSVWSQVYARKGSGFQSILDLNGKRVAALEQTIQLETFRRLANNFDLKITLIPVPDYNTEFELLKRGKVDAGVTNRFYGLMHAREFGLEDTPIMFEPAPFFFAAPRNSSRHLLEIIDRHLADMKKDPQSAYYASLEHWTSKEVEFEFPAWTKILGLLMIAALVSSLGVSLILKNQVNIHTAELKKINSDLHVSEQKYRHLFERNPAPMFIYQRRSLEMLAVNDAFVTHYGYSREEALTLLLTDLYPEEERAPISKLAASLEGHAYVGEWHHRKADGSIITIVVRSHDIDYWGYNARIVVINDVTGMKNLEAELRTINATLDQKVRERTAELLGKNVELESANEKLKELDRLKSAFLASMSHELRTPLNSIIGFTGILLQSLSGPINEEQTKQLAMVKNSANHLLSLISDILDISKIEAGQLTVALEPFDIRESIQKVVQSVRPLAEKKGLDLTVHLADNVGPLTSDVRRVEQVLLNLLSNAVKFTDQGEIRVCCLREADSYVTSVTDTGIGIGDEEMGHLFQPFYQIDTGLNRRFEGTGLGLSICKKLVELMGGRIRVTSSPGNGSTFDFSIPLERISA